VDKPRAGKPASGWNNRPGRTVVAAESDFVGGKVRWIDEPAA